RLEHPGESGLGLEDVGQPIAEIRIGRGKLVQDRTVELSVPYIGQGADSKLARAHLHERLTLGRPDPICRFLQPWPDRSRVKAHDTEIRGFRSEGNVFHRTIR